MKKKIQNVIDDSSEENNGIVIFIKVVGIPKINFNDKEKCFLNSMK